MPFTLSLRRTAQPHIPQFFAGTARTRWAPPRPFETRTSKHNHFIHSSKFYSLSLPHQSPSLSLLPISSILIYSSTYTSSISYSTSLIIYILLKTLHTTLVFNLNSYLPLTIHSSKNLHNSIPLISLSQSLHIPEYSYPHPPYAQSLLQSVRSNISHIAQTHPSSSLYLHLRSPSKLPLFHYHQVIHIIAVNHPKAAPPTLLFKRSEILIHSHNTRPQ